MLCVYDFMFIFVAVLFTNFITKRKTLRNWSKDKSMAKK